MNQRITLLPEDEKILDADYPEKWKIIHKGGEDGLLIKEFRLPDGYTQSTVDFMVRLPEGYPMAKLDMFYLDPAVEKRNGKPIDDVSIQTHLLRSWQQWSRHYDWTPGEDSLHGHIGMALDALEQAASE